MTTNDNCLECNTPMHLEGTIGDDIALCHGCYSNETLEKFGYIK